MLKVKVKNIYEEVSVKLDALGAALSALTLDMYHKCEKNNNVPKELVDNFIDTYELLMRYEMIKNVNPKFSTAIHSMAEFIINKEMVKVTK